jgi:hypothetical protein
MNEEPKYYQLYEELLDLALDTDINDKWNDFDIAFKKKLRNKYRIFLEECYSFIYTENRIYMFPDFILILHDTLCGSMEKFHIIADFYCIYQFALYKYRDLYLKSLEKAKDNLEIACLWGNLMGDLPTKFDKDLNILILSEILYRNPSDEDIDFVSSVGDHYKEIQIKLSMIKSGLKLTKQT